MPSHDKAESKSDEFPIREQNLSFGASVDCEQGSLFDTTNSRKSKPSRANILRTSGTVPVVAHILSRFREMQSNPLATGLRM